jgi:hypothetical protein
MSAAGGGSRLTFRILAVVVIRVVAACGNRCDGVTSSFGGVPEPRNTGVGAMVGGWLRAGVVTVQD